MRAGKTWIDLWITLVDKLPLSKLASYQLTNLIGEAIAMFFVYSWIKTAGLQPLAQAVVVIYIVSASLFCVLWACHR